MTEQSDVITFWDDLDTELAAIPSNPEIAELPQQSTEFSTAYGFRITSIGPYRITGFLSVPHGEGPFPGLFLVPGYASVVTPPPWEDRKRYVVMSLRYRGTRGSDWPYAGKFPGMLTDGIAAPESWIMRGVVADLLRGFEFLVQHPKVDPSRVGIHGGDPGLFVSARRSGVLAQTVNANLFYRMRDAHEGTEAYPLEEINDFVRTNPDQRAAVATTLDYFNPLNLAGSVQARVLLAHDNQPFWEPLQQALPSVEQYQVTHEGQTDRDHIEGWLADQLSAERFPRTWKVEDIGPWTS